MGFRENLKDELTYKGMQTKELAKKTGISLNTLNHYLTQNAASPSAENAVKIAGALGVTVEFLVTGKASPSEFAPASARLRSIVQKLSKLPSNGLTIAESVINSLFENL